MVAIIGVEENSIAEELGIRAGDHVIAVNGKEVEDALDFRFHSAAEEIELLVQKGSDQIIFEIEKEYDENLGLQLEDLTMRSCGNRCVFCFVFQNPKGLRKTLYFKDEDYRFSFLYGHYVTLTNSTQADLDRIVEQRLTPLYVSVHATEPQLRKTLLGINFDDHLLEKIDFLIRHGIELNCQIVLCPELNDGEQLDRTIADLKTRYPGVRSIAVVPVGLTDHRKNLFPIKPVSESYALQTITEVDQRRKKLKEELGSSFVYLSDEFYIRTGLPIPPNDYYEGFYQLENGVGLTRDFLNRFQEEKNMLRAPREGLELSLLTGVLGQKVLKKYFWPDLEAIPGLKFRLHRVTNKFYGSGITISGLLVGQDIYEALKDQKLGDVIVLPPRCLNDDGIFLDDWQPADLEQKLGKPIVRFPGSFTELFKTIESYETSFSYHSR